LLDKAIETYGFKDDPHLLIAIHNRSYCNIHLANYDEAIADLRTIKKADPDSFSLHVNLAGVLDEIEDSESAIMHGERAIEINPREREGYVALSNTYISLGRYEKALELAEKAIEASKGKDIALMNRGVIHSKIGDFRKAFADMEQALSADPESLYTHANLGGLHTRAGNPEEAVKRAEYVLARVSEFKEKDRSINHYFPAITAETILDMLGKPHETGFIAEAKKFGVRDQHFED
jgi:tetratricopeptide (TPR) repeat protein